VNGLPYPWSQNVSDIGIDQTRATYDDFVNPVLERPPAVGTHPAGQGRFARTLGRGHEDLAGSLGEWVLDGWEKSPSTPCQTDCMSGWYDELRVMRGGSFRLGKDFLRTGSRIDATAFNIADSYGFRCARDAVTLAE
jgi:formylglycine-generating enzyme required for sulfatase activity